ncbi:MAG: sodium/proton-translocating pyrophosphatase, partial [Planctomycetota bacterium]
MAGLAAGVAAVLLLSAPASAAEALGGTFLAAVSVPLWWFIAPAGAALGLVFAFIFYAGMKKADPGDEKMQEIAGHVRLGARSYLVRQYKVFAIVAAIIALCFVGL